MVARLALLLAVPLALAVFALWPTSVNPPEGVRALPSSGAVRCENVFFDEATYLSRFDLSKLEKFRELFLAHPESDLSGWRSWSPEKFLAAVEVRTALGEMRVFRGSDSPWRHVNLAALRLRVEFARRDGRLTSREIRGLVAELYKLRHEPAWRSLLRDPREFRESFREYSEELILDRLETALVQKAAVDAFREAGLLSPRAKWERALDWIDKYRGRYELTLSGLFLLPSIVTMDVFSFYVPRWERHRAEALRDQYVKLAAKEGHESARRTVALEAAPGARYEAYYALTRSTANTIIFAALLWALTDEIVENLQTFEDQRALEVEEMRKLVEALLPERAAPSPEELAEEMLQRFLEERRKAGQPVAEAVVPILRQGFVTSFKRAAEAGPR